MVESNDRRGVHDHMLNRRYTRRQVLQGAATGAAVLVGGPLAAACTSSSPSAKPSVGGPGASPVRGGNLRIGILGGSTSDTLDANTEVTQPDTFRVMSLYNGLVRLGITGTTVDNDLAEEMTPSPDAMTWTVRLVQGVTFHNSKDLTAEDVIYTFRRIMNPKNPLVGATALEPLDPNGMKALDNRTIRFGMKYPYASFAEQLSDSYNFGIIPATGYDPAKPVGTGPFKYQSFTAGQQSVFSRNENYFKSGLPHLDQLTIIDSFASDTAAFNALQGGEVDVYASATLSLAKQVQGNSSIKALVTLPGMWTPFTMRVDQAPFNDVRVRQAFRFIVDRPQMIELSLSGFGNVGNDVFSENDKCFDGSLQRSQNLDQAKSLLRRAGHSGMTVELVTADFAPGVLQAAQVFAQQAKGAGVKVKIRQLPVGTFYGPSYLTWTFAQDFWGYNPYLSQVAQATLPKSPYNETHWNDATYNSLYKQANSAVDSTKRCEIKYEMQKIDFERGGYIIAAYNKQLDLLSQRVHGIQPAGTGVAVGTDRFENVWLA